MSIHQGNPRIDALVLYKSRPARVSALDDKIELELEGGQTKRVRLKDVVLLHPGPLRRLADLTAGLDRLAGQSGSFEEAWELLDGESTTVTELAELLYGESSPEAVWASWQLVMEGPLFEGEPEAIRPRAAEVIAQEREQREAKARAEQEWADFVARIEKRVLLPEDGERLREVERMVYQQSEHSRILKHFDVAEQPAKAHAFLLRVGHWPAEHNPYPKRFGVALAAPALPVPELAEEPRLDLTALPAYAIDDAGNQDPDDAISLDGDRVWVHVADVAALVTPGSELDLEARARGATLYLPEGAITMLPEAATAALGMGLKEISPALSFGFRCDEQGELHDIDVRPSWVRVERLSYGETEQRLSEEPFASLSRLVERFRARRAANQAARIDLPEVNLRLSDGQVIIEPMVRLAARELVTDAMLMAGEATARLCQEREIAIPFAVQPPPERIEQPESLSGMHAYRRFFKPSRTTVEPGAHFGLGLPLYTRTTSPLRRYADLLVHQQLRAHLRGEPPLDASDLATRASQAEVAGAAVRKTERLSNQHWKLVYLRAHPGWRGRGVVVAREERRTVVLIPELALETRLRAKQELQLDAELDLLLTSVDLPELEGRFRLVDG
ncbi:Ribonuclease R [Thiorhodovibrio winogradskyi]|uniref:Ribonuclease R n=1 Tax=Thiorhodovibrio winogradskyi TaxID=77007 RepID=A0ABZ0S999_9GAMM|nr:RNB domain-containing ribonuclease [Thiorhodovibrio winogradskyi]